MKISKIIILLLTAFLFSNVHAQNDKPPTQPELDEITARGKMLFEYDVAAWHSTDAVFAMLPEEGSFTHYIARKTEKGWTVAYGKFSEKQDKFLIVYEAVQGIKPEEFKVTKLGKPKEDNGFYLNAAKSLETALAEFSKSYILNRPYNFAVLPAKNEEFFVYALPAQTETGIFPLGGDVRYKVSKDGAKIVETRQMHKSIIEVSTPPKDVEAKTGYHTAVLDDIPEDSDVFHVLTRKFNIPELVVTNKFVFQIAPDGSIKYVMTREAFTKIGQGNSK